MATVTHIPTVTAERGPVQLVEHPAEFLKGTSYLLMQNRLKGPYISLADKGSKRTSIPPYPLKFL